MWLRMPRIQQSYSDSKKWKKEREEGELTEEIQGKNRS
jgi:hypothetical protein